MDDSAYLTLVEVLNQSHLAKKILNYIGNFKDIKNFALSNFYIYNVLKGKHFIYSKNIIDPTSPNTYWEIRFMKSKNRSLSPSRLIPWVKKLMGIRVSTSTMTELEIPFMDNMLKIAPMMASYELVFSNLKKFSWDYSYFTLGHCEPEIIRANNLKMVEHVLEGVTNANNLKFFRFHFFKPIKGNKKGINQKFLEDLIVIFTTYLPNTLTKIEFGNFYTFSVNMMKNLSNHFEKLMHATFFQVTFQSNVSFQNFRSLKYLYLPCFEKKIIPPPQLGVLVVRCCNYQAKIEYGEFELGDVEPSEIEYNCPCRNIKENFSYIINHNVGISLFRLTVYFNNPIYHNYYVNNLPDKREMYLPAFDNYKLHDAKTSEGLLKII
ncbi:Hypothetical protein SRAE_2000505600 [Strongyloides ratti]|uniref:F-box domain-containing protein n=1 Tax=Strongyloides ratti TaxID=34506 RepID=A0A090LKR4_STRRB|nr:Hypothetical protein SRAE_2000505600 [Strongyloides ratti]CEF70424.1 Hypothetical protein SRAE_2000505600 [Strongyloides ratti]